MTKLVKNRKYGLMDFFRVPLHCAPGVTLLILFIRLITGIIPGLQSLFTGRLIDRAIEIASNHESITEIFGTLAVVAGIIAWGYVNVAIYGLLKLKMETSLDRGFQTELLEKRARLKYGHIESNEDQELISRVCGSATRRFHNSMNSMYDLGMNIASIFSVLILLMSQVWWAAIVILLFSIPLGWIAVRVGQVQYREQKRAQRYERRAKYLQSILTDREGVEERTLFGFSEAMNEEWARKYDTSVRITNRQELRRFVRIKGTGMIVLLISALVVITLIFPLKDGTLSVGMFISLSMAAFELVQNLSWSLPYLVSRLAENREYCKELTTFFAMSEQEGALEEPCLPESFHLRDLEFRNVTFAYPGSERKILDGFSARIEAGRHYAVVGANGAGKTTLTRLLTGLYDNYEGEIRINGKELRTYPLSALKAIFRCASQDFARYEVTLRENIELGCLGDETQPDVPGILRTLEMEEMTKSLPNGLGTALGRIRQKAVELSGGQWQRIALARVFASKAEMRILDEPTAALDPMTESSVYAMFGQISQGVTTLFITHRLAAARLADEIIVLENGKAAEIGSHEALMARNGIYAKMYESQRSWFQ